MGVVVTRTGTRTRLHTRRFTTLPRLRTTLPARFTGTSLQRRTKRYFVCSSDAPWCTAAAPAAGATAMGPLVIPLRLIAAERRAAAAITRIVGRFRRFTGRV